MKRGTHFATGLAVAASLMLAACGSKDGQQASAAAGAAMPPSEVDVLTVAKGSVTLTQDLPGRLEAYRTAQMRARVEGVIEKRLFTEGSDVQAGELLFQIDARPYQAAYDSAKAAVEVERQTVGRYKSLLEAKAVSQQDYDLEVAKMKQAESDLAKAALDLENTHVPAPISGHVGRAQVTEGALVGRGEATLLATIEQLDPLYVDFTQPGADLMRLQKAVKSGTLKRGGAVNVQLVLEDGSLYPLPGKLLFSDLAVDPNTGSVALRAEVPNPKHELLPGMYATIRFPEGDMGDSIKVPQAAVLSNPQGQFVMVVDGESKAQLRPIKTGAMSNGDFVVAEGLGAGDKVIVNGFLKVRPGSPVKAVPWNPPGAPQAASAPAAVAANK